MTSLQNTNENFFAPMHPSFNKDVLKLGEKFESSHAQNDSTRS